MVKIQTARDRAASGKLVYRSCPGLIPFIRVGLGSVVLNRLTVDPGTSAFYRVASAVTFDVADQPRWAFG